MAARRRAAGKRWSATASLTLFDASGTPLPDDAEDTAHRAQVRWRVDGKQRKRTFLPDELDDVSGFLTTLRAAYEHDWAADARGWPVVPNGLPGAAPSPVEVPVEEDTLGDVDRVRQLPGAGARPAAIRDVAALVEHSSSHLATTRSPKTGRPRGRSTLRDYRYELDFAVDVLRYPADDPRLERVDAQAGDSLRIDQRDGGIAESDLLAFLEVRERTNRNVRLQNERAMARWATEVEAEERRAADDGRDPELPPPPALEPEVASPRTVQAVANLVSAMFRQAFRREWMSYQPWTPDVDDQVISPAPTAYSRKTVHARSQVDRTAVAIGAVERQAVIDGRWTTVNGERYQGLVKLGGYAAPRPEELIAIRRSWLELDADRPRLALHNALVDGQTVPLKHRRPGEVRYVHLDDEPALVAALVDHLERFVPAADPDSADPDLRDPYVFTTHAGSPLTLSHFGRRWYKPAVRAALDRPGEEELAASTLRLLRASAITHWLAVKEWSTYRCAQMAGNRQDTLEKHYAGVLAEVGYDTTSTSTPTPPPAPSGTGGAEGVADQLSGMDASELTRLIQLASGELGQRSNP